MNKYCCMQLHQLEDDSWERGFGLSIINKGEVESGQSTNNSRKRLIKITLDNFNVGQIQFVEIIFRSLCDFGGAF